MLLPPTLGNSGSLTWEIPRQRRLRLSSATWTVIGGERLRCRQRCSTLVRPWRTSESVSAEFVASSLAILGLLLAAVLQVLATR